MDTRQPSRIGAFAKLLKRKDVEIHIYDHHPKLTDDIRGHMEIVRKTGSTVTILSQILRERGIDITPDEATVMCLGIYEDTGSFTFSSTTEEDFLAAAFLVSKGANLNVISSMISREINPQQLNLLNDLFQGAVNHNINGIDVTITSVSTDYYVPDFAFLVHKMIKMEDLNVVFALGTDGGQNKFSRQKPNFRRRRRRKLPSISEAGGIPMRQQRLLRKKRWRKSRRNLMKFLYQNVSSSKRAKDLMSSPAIKVDSYITCKEAGQITDTV